LMSADTNCRAVKQKRNFSNCISERFMFFSSDNVRNNQPITAWRFLRSNKHRALLGKIQ
jgi:hypothetical protein